MDSTIFGLELGDFTFRVTFLAVVAVVAALLQRVTVRISRHALEAAKVPSASIFINILRVAVWSLALLVVLRPVFGIEPTGFVTALGVGSLVLTLGLQSTISNLISGLSLMLSHVIVPGDVITVGSFTGTVTDINWNATKVRERGGNVEVIPNSVLSSSSFTKLTPGAALAVSLTFSICHDADPDQVEREVIAVAKEALGEAASPDFEPAVRYGSSDAYGTTVTLTTFVVPEVAGFVANDLVARKLAGRPWLARVPS